MASVPCATRSQNGFPGGDQTLAPVVEFHLRARKIRIAVPALTRQLDDNSGTSRTALPLDLAFGLTVHRAAGLTVDAIILHGDSLWPMGGLCYTALSRVRSIEHVQILGSIQDAHIFSRQDCVTFMQEELARSREADNAAPKRQAEGSISPPSKKPNAAPQPQPATAMPAPQPQPSPAAAPVPSRVPPVPAPSPSKKRKAVPPPSKQHQKPTASPAAARRHAVEENIEESRSATGKAPDSNFSGPPSKKATPSKKAVPPVAPPAVPPRRKRALQQGQASPVSCSESPPSGVHPKRAGNLPSGRGAARSLSGVRSPPSGVRSRRGGLGRGLTLSAPCVP